MKKGIALFKEDFMGEVSWLNILKVSGVPKSQFKNIDMVTIYPDKIEVIGKETITNKIRKVTFFNKE